MLSRSVLRTTAGVLVLTIAVTVSGACGDGGAGEATATGRFGGLHAAVCRAAGQAEAGDLAAAEATFDDHHVGLHDLAAAAEQEDRAVAGRLLEAKQRVEGELDAETLRALVDAVAQAVGVTGGTAPDSCP